MALTISPKASALFVSSVVSAGFWLGACTGDDGIKGDTGLSGVAGVPGPQGPAGPQGLAGDSGTGATTNGACTQPCHTFNGVVDQWRLSNHSHPQENEIGSGACGNCHALDGIANRVANQAIVAGDAAPPVDVPKGHLNYATSGGSVAEISYAGASTIGRIHCTTCHDFNSSNDPHVTGKYTAGQAPIRVPGGSTDTVLIEKTGDGGTTPTGQAVAYRAGNLCIFCHKSRKDVTFFITASNTLSTRWGPHNGPQADLYTGKGGYPLNLPGEAYGTSTHVTVADGCVGCHMQPVAENGGVPDHTMKPKVAFCKTCHATYTGTDFNIDAGRTDVRAGLSELEGLLNSAGLLTRAVTAPFAELDADALADNQFQLDTPKSPGTPVDAATAGALYNYLLVARGKDLGVHNPRYTKQLLWDSIRVIRAKGAGGNPTFITARPPS